MTQKLPLEDIRVVDFTAAAAGPHVTQWLGVMGAEIIKVESNIRSDGLREHKPWFAALNHSKKSIALNMRKPRAVELAKELVKLSDIVTENFGGSVLERWGMGYSELKKVKSDIIVYSCSGYGRTGPFKESPAFAPIIDAFSGLTYMNGYTNGEPVNMGSMGWTDLLSGMHGVFAILAALYHRKNTGEGQYIDLSMCEQLIACIPEAVIDYSMNGRIRERAGNGDNVMAPHGIYRCKGEDKWVAIAVSDEEEWMAFCNVIGNPDWTKKDEFSDQLSRWKNQEELNILIQEWTVSHSHYEVMSLMQNAGVMAGACLSIPELVEDCHLNERDFYIDIEDSEEGRLHLARLPWKIRDIPEGNYKPAPSLGEHSDYIFKELLGLNEEEIIRLEKEEVIY